MNVLKKILEFIKNLFIKKDEVKLLEISKNLETSQNEGDNKKEFADEIKVKNVNNSYKKEFISMVCPSNGMGIQTNFTY